MSRRQTEPLRSLTPEEAHVLQQISRSFSLPASHVAHAKSLLAVSHGQSYIAAAQSAGRASGAAVSHLVARFNREGLSGVIPHWGGGPPVRYTPEKREQILALARVQPDREKDGTATWSLTTLQRALERRGGLRVGRSTLWCVLREAGLSWQHSRSWCETGVVERRRKSGVVTVYDPDTQAKKKADRKSLSRR